MRTKQHCTGIDYCEKPYPQLPELRLIGSASFGHAVEGLVEHEHGTCLEVIAFQAGTQWYYQNATPCQVSGGELILFPPHQRHSTRHSPQTKSHLYWIQLDLGLPGPFLGLALYEPLRSRLLALPFGGAARLAAVVTASGAVA